MKTKTKYDLIGDIVAYINSEEYDATITHMASDCCVPLVYMRKTLLTMLNNKILQACLYTNDDYDDDKVSLMEYFLDNPDAFTKKLLQGRYDDIAWEMNLRVLDANEDELLTLTHMEFGAIKLLKENALTIKRGALFEKKETINPISAEVRKNKKIILDAIERNAAISFIYKNRQNLTEQVKCYPIELFTNVNDNWVYFRSSEGKLYRLDRIIQGCKTLKDAIDSPEIPSLPNLKYAWGSYYKYGEEPIHVKIRISPETRNIIQKIKSDVEYRKNTCKFYPDGDYYYYEDDIIGINEFQRWVRSYGSSIVVLEPENLHNLISERALQTLELYKASDKWGEL